MVHCWRIGGINLSPTVQEILCTPPYQVASVPDWDHFQVLIPQCDCLLFAPDQETEFTKVKDLGWQMPMVFPHSVQAEELPQQINKALAHFVRQHIHQTKHQLADQLQSKLQERLGYLGIFYKRSPDFFLRNLPPTEKAEQMRQLSNLYRQIILAYFQNQDSNVNQKIDEFTSLAFLGDVSMSQILEIHMKLMDDFSKQLKIENRSDDILVDYRITLIDVIAHLCEMYRRSIAKESR